MPISSNPLETALESLNVLERLTLFVPINQLPSHLAPGERPDFILHGRVNGKEGLLVITPRRVFFLHAGLFSRFIREIPYKNLTALDSQVGLFYAQFAFLAAGATLRVTHILQKQLAPAAADVIRTRMSESATPGSQPAKATHNPNPPSASTEDVIPQLTKLADLRDRGVLTEGEFQEEKRRLLRHDATEPTESDAYDEEDPDQEESDEYVDEHPLPFLRKVLGFRSGVKWKISLATAVYGFFIILFLVNTFSSGKKVPDTPPLRVTSSSTSTQSSDPAPAPAPSIQEPTVDFSGRIDPTLAHVGDKVVITFTTSNLGGRDIDNFRVLFSSRKFFDSMTIANTIPSSKVDKSAGMTSFEWGKLPKGEKRTYNIIMYPNQPGNYESEVYPKDGALWLKGSDNKEITLGAKLAVIR